VPFLNRAYKPYNEENILHRKVFEARNKVTAFESYYKSLIGSIKEAAIDKDEALGKKQYEKLTNFLSDKEKLKNYEKAKKLLKKYEAETKIDDFNERQNKDKEIDKKADSKLYIKELDEVLNSF
jgi:dTDP-4-dehydrorhamnose reductase